MRHDARLIDWIVLHHSASSGSWTWRSIQDSHMRRWKIRSGYHRIVERDGFVMDGRRIQQIGYHAPPNAGRLGIVAIGWNESWAPAISSEARKAGWSPQWSWTDAQWDSLLHLELPYWLKRFPEAMILGHNQTRATLCPGFDVHRELGRRGFSHMERVLEGPVVTT